MNGTAYFLISLCVVLVCVIYRRATRKFRILEQFFPQWKGSPFIGHVLLMREGPEGLYKRALSMPQMFDYRAMTFRVFHKAYVVLLNPDEAKTILSSNRLINKSDEYKFIRPFSGDGLFLAREHQWRRNRRKLAPTFNVANLRKFIPIFYENTKIICRDLAGKGSVTECQEIMRQLALCNMCETALGVRNSDFEKFSKYGEAIRDACETIYNRWVNPHLQLEWIFNFSKWKRVQQRAMAEFNSITDELIQKQLSQREDDKMLATVEEKEQNGKKTFIDVMLDEHDWTSKELRDEISTFVYAGHDTVALSLAFVMYQLSEHQDVQEKVYEEVTRILQDEDRSPSYEELFELTYLEQVIKESLRLNSTVSFVAREVNEDFSLGDGRYIPKGVTAIVNIAGIQRDPREYKTPNRFNPDHFSAEESKRRHSYAYLPFGAGPRNCIGYTYALLEMKVILSTIIQKYHILRSEMQNNIIKPKLGFVLTSSNGINLKLENRNA